MIALIFNFTAKHQAKNITNLQAGQELTCESAEGTVRKLAFHTKHEKMFWNFSMFSLSNVSVEIPRIYHSGIFCCLLLQGISASLPKAVSLFQSLSE